MSQPSRPEREDALEASGDDVNDPPRSTRGTLLELAPDRLAQQIDFLIEIDRLKNILRQTLLSDSTRRENSAEHSWHIALFAVVLAEHSNEPIDQAKVIKMLLVHDIVEVDAGDTFCYDETANLDKLEREQAAARRIFGKLPRDQAAEFRALWDEFEECESSEARFANAVDRLQPMLHNVLTQGYSWRQHDIVKEQVLTRNRPVADGSAELWQFAEGFLDEAERSGWFGRTEPANASSASRAVEALIDASSRDSEQQDETRDPVSSATAAVPKEESS